MNGNRSFPACILRDALVISTCVLSLCGAVFLVPQLRGLKMYAVTSGSMEPAIPEGALILVDPAERTPEVGAVMTYRLGGNDQGMTVTHRVHEIRPNGTLLMKGDANTAPDLNVISPDCLIGTVVSSIPRLGFLQSAKSLRFGFVCMSVLCMAGWLAADLVNYRKGENE